jgi:hypothetical protein
MARVPKYRADVKGNVAKLIEEATDVFWNNIHSDDCFVFCVEDCASYDEYFDYLTDAELARAFKAASKRHV